MLTILKVSDEGIFRFKDSSTRNGDKVSNFTIALKASLDVEMRENQADSDLIVDVDQNC